YSYLLSRGPPHTPLFPYTTLFRSPEDMLAELCEDNKTLAARLREAHNVCEEYRDLATASLIEVWIDETERRTWFLFASSRREMTDRKSTRLNSSHLGISYAVFCLK